jgi:uncharacterized membrane protein
MQVKDPLRFHRGHTHLHGVFGQDKFGQEAEAFARFFGTPKFLVGQTLFVVLWIIVNATTGPHWDPYPFILLNLLFSTQAAYAAPLILLAQTRQADRDKEAEKADAEHREALASIQTGMLKQNTEITQAMYALQRTQMSMLEDLKDMRGELAEVHKTLGMQPTPELNASIEVVPSKEEEV